VRECVSALSLLQCSVTAERLRHEGLERAVFAVQASLSQVRWHWSGHRRVSAGRVTMRSTKA